LASFFQVLGDPSGMSLMSYFRGMSENSFVAFFKGECGKRAETLPASAVFSNAKGTLLSRYNSIWGSLET
jgi:hypothetical protein